MDTTLKMWLLYTAGALGLVIVWWRLLAFLPWRFLRIQLWAIGTVVLLMPFNIGDGYPQLAPAFLMASMEGVFEGPEALERVAPSLLMAISGTIIVVGILQLIFRPRKKKRNKTTSKKAASSAKAAGAS